MVCWRGLFARWVICASSNGPRSGEGCPEGAALRARAGRKRARARAPTQAARPARTAPHARVSGRTLCQSNRPWARGAGAGAGAQRGHA
ncbi:MAG: hypothetical protein J3K34DRAFT_422669 [Monoraphidium minutum]|nr:MAG: hypothetical protein J3K34DRAFT_422669 [Monoraphidium minutum]